MIISVPSDPGLRRIVLPSVIRISDAGFKKVISETSSRSRKRQLKFDFGTVPIRNPYIRSAELKNP